MKRFRFQRPTWSQALASAMIVSVGLLGAKALGHVNQDLRVLYTEYTLAAVDLAHISGDLMRYRNTIVRALEAPDRKTFEQITVPLPAQRAHIQHAVDRYAAASLRVSRSGRSEPADLEAVRESLDAYFSSASRTISLLTQSWSAATPQQAAELRHMAELHAADNAGPKVIQVSLAVDHLLETVAEVAKDMRDDGTRTVQETSTLLIIATILAAGLNLVARRPRRTEAVGPRDWASLPSDQAGLPTIPSSLPGEAEAFRTGERS
jgi:hypothetical protein